MFEAFFLVGQEILYETSKYYVVVNSREFLLYLPSEKHSFEYFVYFVEKEGICESTSSSAGSLYIKNMEVYISKTNWISFAANSTQIFILHLGKVPNKNIKWRD